MDFLCPNHRKQFAELPLQERRDLWLSWMEHARTCGQQGQWRELLSLAGSAFDLACLHDGRDESPMHIELTLSAILVCHALYDLGDKVAKEKVTLRALERLVDIDSESFSGDSSEVQECIAVLMDRSRQPAFFSDYLNWSRFHGRQSSGVVVGKTLH